MLKSHSYTLHSLALGNYMAGDLSLADFFTS